MGKIKSILSFGCFSILGNREEKCHVPLNADMGYFFFSVSSMNL